MPKFLTILSILAVALYTAVMGYSLGVVAETDSSVASALLRNVSRAGTTTNTYATHDWKTFEEGTYDAESETYEGFKLSYPRDFERVVGADAAGGFVGTPVVRIAFPEDAYRKPKTNYVEAFMTVRSADDANSVMHCYDNPQLGTDNVTLSMVATINGISFRRGTLVEGAAGNIYDTQLYRTLRDDRCYEVSLTVHTGNIANYPSGSVAEFDKDRAFRILDRMLDTFTFTDKAPL